MLLQDISHNVHEIMLLLGTNTSILEDPLPSTNQSINQAINISIQAGRLSSPPQRSGAADTTRITSPILPHAFTSEPDVTVSTLWIPFTISIKFSSADLTTRTLHYPSQFNQISLRTSSPVSVRKNTFIMSNHSSGLVS